MNQKKIIPEKKRNEKNLLNEGFEQEKNERRCWKEIWQFLELVGEEEELLLPLLCHVLLC